ncbi:MAG: alanine racemase [Acidobacteriota bacterium]
MSRFTLKAGALAANLSLARKWAPNGARVRAMVKAKAYGHGLDPLINVFVEHSDELGVATLEEGLEIRSCLERDFPIFVMSRAKDLEHPATLEALRRACLVPAISSLDELRLLLDRLGTSTGIQIELKLDTGMGRLGIQEDEVPELLPLLNANLNLQVTGILTHFASSDEEDLEATWAQERCFRRMVDQFPSDVVKAASLHSCNSGALIQRSLGHRGIAKATQIVRPGVMLYGAAPSSFLQRSPSGQQLTPVGRWTTRVLEVRNVQPGRTVGYGGAWRVEGEKPARVAVLAVGYADGFRRVLGNRGRVLIRGGSFPVIGRVSMDLISVLVDGRIRVGDEAVLLGSQKGECGADTISAWELSSLCDTIPYEIWTSISGRVDRKVGH